MTFKQDSSRGYTNISSSNSDEILRSLLSSVYGLPFLPIYDVLPTWTESKTMISILYPSSSEVGNNALNRAFKAAHPSQWTFITQLRKFHAEVETKYLQLAVGTMPSQPVAKKWRVRDGRLKRLVDNYNPSEKLDFIRKIGYMF